MTSQLETERLILRPFQKDDLDAIYEIFSNEKVNTYLPWFALKNKEEAQVFMKIDLQIQKIINMPFV